MVCSYTLWRIASLANTVNCSRVQLCAGIERLLVCRHLLLVVSARAKWKDSEMGGSRKRTTPQTFRRGKKIILKSRQDNVGRIRNPLLIQTPEANVAKNIIFTQRWQQYSTPWVNKCGKYAYENRREWCQVLVHHVHQCVSTDYALAS